MTKEKKDPIIEIEAPAIKVEEPVLDPMQEILKSVIAMQAKTNQTLESLAKKVEDFSTIAETKAESLRSEEDMMKDMNNRKIIQKKMYKVLIIKQVLPMDASDSNLHGDSFSNGGIVWGDTNKRFDSEKEANAYGEETAPGKYKLLPVTVPVPEGQVYKTRRPNITM